MEHELELEIFREAAVSFRNFLKNDFTSKIVFSGKYGAGKTTFLNCFFDNGESLGLKNGAYDVFRISPVHYSIASNEDIIELIKYDIVSQFLVKPHIEIIENDVPFWYLVSGKDAPTILENVLSLVTTNGVGLGPVIEKAKALDKYFKQKKKDQSESLQFLEFLSKMEDKPGVWERDVTTRLIENVLTRQKEKENKRIPILLIDDFDRLDPEHIFRILNVFSAHVDEDLHSKNGKANKFGFSKVIIVCDHHNIRSLFHTRYGKEADFNGYFDKFYNKTIFEFDIRKEVRNYLGKLLARMHRDVVFRYHSELAHFNRSKDELFIQTLEYAILTGHFALRNLLRLKDFNIEEHYQRLFFKIGIKIRNNEFTLFELLLNLFLFQGTDGFIGVLNEMYARGINIRIDQQTHFLISSLEDSFVNEANNELRINTDFAFYKYQKTNGEWQYNGGNLLPGKTSNNIQDQTIDLLRHFVKRIKQAENG